MKDLAIDRMNVERAPEWFISRITSGGYVRHNRLEEAVEDEVEKYDRWIISAAEIENFKTQFKKRIDELYKEYPRCKPLYLSIWQPRKDLTDEISQHDIQFSFSINLTLTLFAMKGYPKHSQVNSDLIIF